MKARSLAVFVTASVITTAAHAVTVETGNFISSPTYFNGFESIPNDGTYYTGFPAAYSEGGITVKYVGVAQQIWVTFTSTFGGQGSFGWYPNNPNQNGFGYTDVQLTSGNNIPAIQFLAGSGFTDNGYLEYNVLNNGTSVLTGSLFLPGSSMTYVGFNGGGFNEIQLQVQSASASFPFDPTASDAGAFDSFAVGTPSVPEPSTWAMMIIGFVSLGFMTCRRKKKLPRFV